MKRFQEELGAARYQHGSNQCKKRTLESTLSIRRATGRDVKRPGSGRMVDDQELPLTDISPMTENIRGLKQLNSHVAFYLNACRKRTSCGFMRMQGRPPSNESYTVFPQTFWGIRRRPTNHPESRWSVYCVLSSLKAPTKAPAVRNHISAPRRTSSVTVLIGV